MENKETGIPSVPVWGQADVLGRHEQEERVPDFCCCHSYKASCSLFFATLPFSRIRAVKNYSTCYAFLSNPATASHTNFPVSAAILISLCKSLEQPCFFHSPPGAFHSGLGSQSLNFPCICHSALFIPYSLPLTVRRGRST